MWQSIIDPALVSNRGRSDSVSYLSLSDYASFALDQSVLDLRIDAAPTEAARGAGSVITLPTPEGEFQQFAFWDSPIMAPELAAQFPEIQTFAAQGIDDPAATARLDRTPQGFHAQVLSPKGSYYVDPFYHLQPDGPYVSYFSSACLGDDGHEFVCHTEDVDLGHGDLLTLGNETDPHANHDHSQYDGCCCPDCALIVAPESNANDSSGNNDESSHQEYCCCPDCAITVTPCSNLTVDLNREETAENSNRNEFSTLDHFGWHQHGSQLRTYDLLVAATGEYSQFHGGTVNAATAAIATTINRVTHIFERDIGVRINFAYSHIELDPYTDDYNLNQFDSTNNSEQVQDVIDYYYGYLNTDYDFAHTFHQGFDGGSAGGLGTIANHYTRAAAWTSAESPVNDSFNVDFVAHEMGHQFNASHSFNAPHPAHSSNGGGRWYAAIEPGSGSTIMSYAGIIDGENLQNHVDPYFNIISIDEMVQFTTSGAANAAATITNTGNNLPSVSIESSLDIAGYGYRIPFATPFYLTATGSDPDAGDTLTYCWEQIDAGMPQSVHAGDDGFSPLFRSWNPTTNATRYFPREEDVLDGSTVVGETLQTYLRDLNFAVTIRDNRINGGGIGYETISILVDPLNNATPFAVTSPNSAVSWTGGAIESVSWDVAGTDSAAFGVATVDILVSTDGGTTYSAVATGVANDGSHNITVPNTPTSALLPPEGSSGWQYFLRYLQHQFLDRCGQLQ